MTKQKTFPCHTCKASIPADGPIAKCQACGAANVNLEEYIAQWQRDPCWDLHDDEHLTAEQKKHCRAHQQHHELVMNAKLIHQDMVDTLQKLEEETTQLQRREKQQFDIFTHLSSTYPKLV